MLNLATPTISTVSDAVINAVRTGATMYQAMSLVVACFDHFWDGVHPNLAVIASLIQEQINSDVVPINGSCLVQMLVSALYSHLLVEKNQHLGKEVKFLDRGQDSELELRNSEDVSSAVAECLCSIDEDNKHNDQIDDFLKRVSKSLPNERVGGGHGCSRVESNQKMCETLASDILMTNSGKRCLKSLHHFIKCNGQWLYQQLGVSNQIEKSAPTRAAIPHYHLLHTMFHIGYRPFDQMLSGDWVPNWSYLYQIPMGLHTDIVWKQVSSRWDFRMNTNSTHVINVISNILKQ